MEKAVKFIEDTVKAVFNLTIDVEMARPDPQFGDYATNAAFKIAKEVNENLRAIAEKLVAYINDNKPEWLAGCDVASPGFINLKVNDSELIKVLADVQNRGSEYGKTERYKGQSIVVEYLDPNPMKEIHIGHAYQGVTGDAISCLYEAAGASVHRVTYQGDVGLHVAKAIFGILQKINHDPSRLEQIEPAERPSFLGETYSAGAKAYEADESAKEAITGLNKNIYDKDDSIVNQIYDTCKSWSMAYFDDVYKAFGFSVFEKNYMEGAVAQTGTELVRQHLNDGVFKESQGAIIFEGEIYGLHTRVFITSQGLPTYDAKDLGNAMLKWQDYNYDRSVIITGHEQAEYFKVMLKALEQFAPEQANRTNHISAGLVKLSTGKMSSRTGDVVRALDLLQTAEAAAKTLATDSEAPIHDTALAAIKYAFLKNRIGNDIIYDVNESLSLEGNSGPYIQYAYARARSVIAKSNLQPKTPTELIDAERTLVSKILEFPEVIGAAVEDRAPHLICTYLYELAQTFNSFYEHCRIVGDNREAERLTLVNAYSIVLKNGLSILKIAAPDRM
jgi:arginyl-tRNA synthetase